MHHTAVGMGNDAHSVVYKVPPGYADDAVIFLKYWDGDKMAAILQTTIIK